MLAEVRRSDSLPIRSFAAHTAHASDSTFRPVRSSEAPEHLFRLNFRTNAENFSRWCAECSGWRMAAEILL
jgi:hypothetical protein